MDIQEERLWMEIYFNFRRVGYNAVTSMRLADIVMGNKEKEQYESKNENESKQ